MGEEKNDERSKVASNVPSMRNRSKRRIPNLGPDPGRYFCDANGRCERDWLAADEERQRSGKRLGRIKCGTQRQEVNKTLLALERTVASG